jgi:hypothetical protein
MKLFMVLMVLSFATASAYASDDEDKGADSACFAEVTTLAKTKAARRYHLTNLKRDGQIHQDGEGRFVVMIKQGKTGTPHTIYITKAETENCD